MLSFYWYKFIKLTWLIIHLCLISEFSVIDPMIFIFFINGLLDKLHTIRFNHHFKLVNFHVIKVFQSSLTEEIHDKKQNCLLQFLGIGCCNVIHIEILTNNISFKSSGLMCGVERVSPLPSFFAFTWTPSKTKLALRNGSSTTISKLPFILKCLFSPALITFKLSVLNLSPVVLEQTSL